MGNFFIFFNGFTRNGFFFYFLWTKKIFFDMNARFVGEKISSSPPWLSLEGGESTWLSTTVDNSVDSCMDTSAASPLTKVEYLRERVQELTRSPAWNGQIFVSSREDSQLTVQVRNRFVRDWVRESYLPSFKESLKDLPGEEPALQFLVVPGVGEDPRVSAQVKPAPHPEPAPALKTLFHETLKKKYSFESFVVGNSNQFAHAGARAVAELPGKNYNPLFIYGGVGLGKTHLLNAIGMETLKNNRAGRVIFISAEKFMNEMIYCLRHEKMSDFRKKYRDGCDLLLVDDIQFIAGKERTQEEFFHTFNHLHDIQKQIVLTSDRPPREIPDLEQRLKSRFEWGLIADIQIPDLETRMAILKKKAEEDRIEIDDPVALFLATHIKSNVRELEGALIRLNAFASLNHVPISVALAKDVLKNVLGSVERVLTVEQIQKVVSDFYSIKLVDLTGKRRVRSLALPRQIAMYLCRKHVKSSFPEIGTKFGGKDHSTVIHAFSKITRVLESDPALKDQIDSLEHDLTR